MPAPRKVRSDRWDANLTTEQVWRAYDVFRRSHYTEFLAWAERELPEVELPGRNSLYKWARHMRQNEAAHRIRQAAQARAEIGALAETAALDDDLKAAYKSMAASYVLQGNSDEAVRLTETAMKIAAQQKARAELELRREKFEATEKRATAAEKRAQAAERKTAALQEQLKALEQALQDAGKVNAADPAAVAAEIDKLLGRRPAQ